MNNKTEFLPGGNPPSGVLQPIVNFTDESGAIVSIFPEIKDTIARTEQNISAAVLVAQSAGTNVVVRFVCAVTGRCVSQVRIVA